MLLYDIYYHGGEMDTSCPLPRSNFALMRSAKCVNGEPEILYPDGDGGWTKEAPLRNYAVFRWTSAHEWLARGCFNLPGAKAQAGRCGVIIDLVSKRMIYAKGKFCDRAKPVGIRSLPAIEVNT